MGPNQYPEKVVPLFTTKAMDDIPVRIYGDGGALRDYLYVEDHCSGMEVVMDHGRAGEAYNIGAGHQVNTQELADGILSILGKSTYFKQAVPDRMAHDRRYCLDSGKLRALGWAPTYDFGTALERTVHWYEDNEQWWRPLKQDGSFKQYIAQNEAKRGAALAP
jgi:dTDP-glucose 4,6-dehydratase